jgi:hypothetical protein
VSAESFLARAGRAVRLGSGRVLISLRDRVVEAYEHLARVWESFDRFRSIDEQSRELARRGWESDGSLAEEVRTLERIGLLRRKSDILADLCRGGRADAPPPRTAAWLTRGRPRLAARSILSFTSACGDQDLEIRIFDDTPDCRDIGPLAAELSRAGTPQRGRRSVLCADRQAAARYRDRLAALSGAPPALVAFAVDGAEALPLRFGAASNLLLLSGGHDRYLQSDDDTVFGLRAPDFCDASSTRIAARFDPLEVLYPETPDDVENLPVTDASPLEAHGRLLGRTMADCLGTGTVDLGDVTPDLAEELLNGEGRVAATMAGIAGYTGTENSRMILGLRGQSREAEMACPDSYRRARLSRTYIRAAPSWVVSAGELFMATSIGLDPARMLPPFPPMGRNGDGLFGMVLRRVLPDGLIGHLPFAVLHDPGPLGPFPPESLHLMAPRTAELMTLLLTSCPRLFGGAPEARMAQLGGHLVAAASLGVEDFEVHLRELWLKQMQGYVGYLDGLLSRFERTPEEWARDVEQHIDAVSAHALTAHPMVPRDVPGEPLQALTAARDACHMYGELLAAWPLIRGAAARIEEPLMKPLGA